MNSKYKRILLKLSGESLGGNEKTGINFSVLSEIALIIKKASEMGVQTAVVVGGGNFWRGRSSASMNRIRADHMGMLATVMNALALSDSLEQFGAKTSLLTSIPFPQIGKLYSPDKAISDLQSGKTVIFAYGTGNAFFSTDTAAALRAAEINAEIILKATGADGVYDSDPSTNPNATKYSDITFNEVLAKDLKVMDGTAASLCRDNNLPIKVFSIKNPKNILKALYDDSVGTLVNP